MATDTAPGPAPTGEGPNWKPVTDFFSRIKEFLKRIFGIFDQYHALRVIRSHNSQLSVLLTKEGRREMDRLVLLEAGVMAHMSDTMDQIAEGKIDEVMARANFKPQVITGDGKKQIVEKAKEKGWKERAVDKCKLVANNAIKSTVKKVGNITGDEDSDEGDSGDDG